MNIRAKGLYLESHPDKRSQELFIRGTVIRASTMWHDRYVSRMSPDMIARDHDIPAEAVYELRQDQVIQGALGVIYDEFVELKEAEWKEYHMQVSAWELDRYLTMF